MSQKIRIEHNCGCQDLIKGLGSLAIAENIGDDLTDFLHKAHKSEEEQEGARIREEYMKGILHEAEGIFKNTIETLINNLKIWFRINLDMKIQKSVNQGNPGLMLDTDQIWELKSLIEAHFTPQIRFGGNETIYQIPKDVIDKWKKEGIIAPAVDITKIIKDAYTAGRLYQVLTDSSNYAEMLKMAKALPMTRSDFWAVKFAEQNAAQNLTGYSLNMAGKAVSRLLQENRKITQDIIAGYMKKELPRVKYDPQQLKNLTPAELKLLDSGKIVKNWRELSSELYHTFKGEDAKRDWMRVATTETRAAFNIGRLRQMDEDKVEEIYFLVRPEACDACRKLYLEKDNMTPKIFKLSYLLDNVFRTGGMNIGRKKSMIGDPDKGWIPNAIVHPYCMCRPTKKIKGVDPIKSIPR